MRARRKRGQATVELAFGSLIFVTVLMAGIYFAEVGHLSLKVIESAETGLFDTTAAKMHRIWDPQLRQADWTPYRNAIANAGPAATVRHASFDSRAEQVFARARGLRVTCEEAPRVPSLRPALPGFPRGDSGMECTAEAMLGSVRVPHDFATGPKGFFTAEHWQTRPIKVCAAGRAVNGQCSGRFGVLLDDWGLAGPDERKECRLFGVCENPGFYDLARRTYYSGANIWAGSAQNLLDHVTGGARPLPMEEGKFRMSFRGSESNYLEVLPLSHGDVTWETTAYRWPEQYSTPRSRCWLGDPC